MAYQDVFVQITDTNGSRQSHSCRKKVNWVDTNVYFSNGARIGIMSKFNSTENPLPVIDINCDGASKTEPIIINLTNLLFVEGVTFRIGGTYIDTAEINKPEELLKRIVAEQLSA